MAVDPALLRKTVFEVIEQYHKIGPGYFQSSAVLKEVANRLKIRHEDDQQLLLTVWYDLFRVGVLSWGLNLSNIDPPSMHLTEVGRRTLSQASKDPYNPEGYLTAVRPHLLTEPVALSYVTEAVHAFQANCFKSSAVMIGAAAESLVLSVRDNLVTRLTTVSAALPSQLTSQQIKTVRDAIEKEIDNRKGQLDRKLYERFSGFWMAISDQMRLVRNDVGHPKSVDPVTQEVVHGNLLLFPSFAELVKDLIPSIATFVT